MLDRIFNRKKMKRDKIMQRVKEATGILEELEKCNPFITPGGRGLAGQKEEQMGQKFWLCWLEGTTRGYHHRHDSFDAAKTEAARLARLPGNNGRKVFILEAIGYCEVPEIPVEYHSFDPPPMTISDTYQWPKNS